jgi:predicted secreted acid phosphatase
MLNYITLPKNPVIVFDIDNTLIDSCGKSIIPIVNLFNYAKSIGITPVIITNRTGDKKTIDFTQNQLRDYGIDGYRFLFFRKPTLPNNPFRYKEKARLKLYLSNMTVIMSIGDHEWDIGKYGGIGFLLPVYV